MSRSKLSFALSRRHYVPVVLRYLTLRKLANLFHCGLSYLFRLRTSGAVPPVVTLMLTYRCNLNCIMCQKSSRDENEYHNPKSMDFGELKRFIEEYGDRIMILRLFGGEPLFYSQIDEVLDLLHEHRIAYTVGTNGILLTAPIVEKITGRCAWVSISIDSANNENYARIRKGGDLETIKNNLRLIRDLKNTRNTTYPIVNGNATIFTYNLNDIAGLIHFCKSFDIESLSLSAGRLYNTPEVTEEHLIQNDKERARRVVDRARALAEDLGFNLRIRMRSLYMAPRSDEQKERDSRKRNPGLYFEMTIQPDFQAVTGFEGYRAMGTISDNDLEQVWNGDGGGYALARNGSGKAIPAAVREASA